MFFYHVKLQSYCNIYLINQFTFFLFFVSYRRVVGIKEIIISRQSFVFLKVSFIILLKTMVIINVAIKM